MRCSTIDIPYVGSANSSARSVNVQYILYPFSLLSGVMNMRNYIAIETFG